MTDPAATTPVPPEVPARRATDLPADAPWYLRYIEANIKEAWKWASVRLPAAGLILAELYAADPAGVQSIVQQYVPAGAWPHLLAAGCAVQMLLRVVNVGPAATDATKAILNAVKPKGTP